MSDALSPRDELAAALIGMLSAGWERRPVEMADQLIADGWRKPSATPGLRTFRRPGAAVPAAEITAAAHRTLDIVRDLEDMVAGQGAHAEHTRRQAGRCVVCSCGARAQGRLPR
jgi:hypothetical protein